MEHARDYAIIGCVELGSAEREYSSSSSILLNLSAAFDLTLYNGKRPLFTGSEQLNPDTTPDPKYFKTYEVFWTAFAKQLTWLVEQAIALNDALGKTHQEVLPSPLFIRKNIAGSAIIRVLAINNPQPNYFNR